MITKDATWRQIEDYALEQIEQLRDELESTPNIEQTRGQIIALRKLLRLAEVPELQAATNYQL